MVPFARRVRTIRMCSLDARGEGPIQATLLRNGEEKICEKEDASLANLRARATRGLRRPSLNARKGDQTHHPLEIRRSKLGQTERESRQASFLLAEPPR